MIPVKPLLAIALGIAIVIFYWCYWRSSELLEELQKLDYPRPL